MAGLWSHSHRLMLGVLTELAALPLVLCPPSSLLSVSDLPVLLLLLLLKLLLMLGDRSRYRDSGRLGGELPQLIGDLDLSRE